MPPEPSLSESDAAFLKRAGVSLFGLDAFGEKLAARRLRRAIEESTKSDTELTTERLRTAFYVEPDTNGFDTFNEVGVGEAVSLLSTRMQAVTDASGQFLFVCSLDTPTDELRKAAQRILDDM